MDANRIEQIRARAARCRSTYLCQCCPHTIEVLKEVVRLRAELAKLHIENSEQSAEPKRS